MVFGARSAGYKETYGVALNYMYLVNHLLVRVGLLQTSSVDPNLSVGGNLKPRFVENFPGIFVCFQLGER